jgi:hypothetical protein
VRITNKVCGVASCCLKSCPLAVSLVLVFSHKTKVNGLSCSGQCTGLSTARTYNFNKLQAFETHI